MDYNNIIYAFGGFLVGVIYVALVSLIFETIDYLVLKVKELKNVQFKSN